MSVGTMATHDEQEALLAVLPRGVEHLDEVAGAEAAPEVVRVHVDLLVGEKFEGNVRSSSFTAITAS